MNDRINRLQESLRDQEIDLVAVGPTANMRYLAGYASHPDERLCLLLITPDEVRAVVPTLNAEDWIAHCDITPVTWADSDGPSRALSSALSARQPRRVAVDGTMRADFLLTLLEATKPETARVADSLISPLRARKSADEIEALQRSAALADRAVQAVMDACAPGVTEAELTWVAETTFRQGGASRVEFTLIASGPNGAFPHHHSGARRLQRGDAVIIDIGATLDYYVSDVTRVIFLGDPPSEFLRRYAAVKAANEAGRAAVRPGVAAQDVDRATRSVLAEAGLGEHFVHRTGHGLGLEVHEPPWIMAGNDAPLAEGMVFSVEPGIYLPGRYGIRIEDIVVVTTDGVRTLTGFDHELAVRP
ncbi:MAG: aminopeptidase P family protein [Caldilineales bacterium]|nr:aminopeptidase P family protein [Caldilineales bacterium]